MSFENFGLEKKSQSGSWKISIFESVGIVLEKSVSLSLKNFDLEKYLGIDDKYFSLAKKSQYQSHKVSVQKNSWMIVLIKRSP